VTRAKNVDNLKRLLFVDLFGSLHILFYMTSTVCFRRYFCFSRKYVALHK